MAIESVPGFTVGCDPELFILDENGVAVTAEGIIPGTKEEPYPVQNGAVQVDGMAAEFNIDPASNFDDFNRNIVTVLAALRRFLPKGYSLSMVPSMVFSEDSFDKAPDIAKILGCNPDFNAWTGAVNPPPSDPDNPYLRTASGHVHYGWGNDYSMGDMQHIMNCQDLVKQLDWFLGAWSVSLDTDPTRRRLYGKAGAYRPKPYGVEYRVLSNFWITSKDRRQAVWDRSMLAINDMRKRFLPEQVPSGVNDLVVEYINKTERNPELERSYRYPIMSTEYYRPRSSATYLLFQG